MSVSVQKIVVFLVVPHFQRFLRGVTTRLSVSNSPPLTPMAPSKANAEDVILLVIQKLCNLVFIRKMS